MASTRPGAPPWGAPVVAGVVGIGVMSLALVLGGGAWQPSIEGLPDAGPIVGWGLPAVRLLTLILGILTVSALLYAAVLGPAGTKGNLSRPGRSAVMRAGVLAAAWAISAVAAAVLTLAYVLALPLDQAVSPSILATYAWDLQPCQAFLLMALFAVIIAIGSLTTASVASTMGWLVIALLGIAFPALGGHAAGLGDHALAITTSVAHEVAATLWFAGVLAVLGSAWRKERTLQDTATRFGSLATWTVGVLAVSGMLNAYAHLGGPADLVGTAYGRLVLLKSAVLLALLAVAAHLRLRLVPRLGTRRGGMLAWLGLEVGLLAIALGLAVALARTPIPRVVIDLPTAGEQLLGYLFPPEPTAARVLLGWHPDAFFLATCLLAAALYVAGYVRLRARGDSWPLGRLVAWLLGIGAVIWSTNAGIASYSPLSFSLHMLQHMTLAMVAPILLVLGGPMTLALRALRPSTTGGRGPREWLTWGLHTPVARFLTNPFVVLFLYTVGLYGLYYTSIFGTLMGTHVGHLLMNVHFIAAGYLFYWVVIGVDPLPTPVPYWGKLVLLLVSIVVHSFFALPIMMASEPMLDEWFSLVRPPWLLDPLADTHVAGGIAWGFGEIPALVVLVALSVQWARSDEREARRRDRRADRDGDIELQQYNARLARLAAADRARERDS